MTPAHQIISYLLDLVIVLMDGLLSRAKTLKDVEM